MGLYYPSQRVDVLVGTKSGTTPTAVVLTNAYDVANKTKILDTGGFSKISLDIIYTVGAAETSNSVEVRVESSVDGVNFARLVNESVSTGTSTLTQREFTFVGASAGAYSISLPLDIGYKFMRFSFKETGVVTNVGSIYVESTLSGK